MPYEHTAYPKMKYHATLPPRTVANEEEDTALGPGWFEHPDDAKQDDSLKPAAPADTQQAPTSKTDQPVPEAGPKPGKVK